MNNVEFEFNFVGVNAGHFRRALRFYTNTMGVHPAETDEDADGWAMLVAGWDESPTANGRGLRCELFQREIEPPTERWWGRNQNIRPSIQVTDLPTVRAELQRRGVSFTGDISGTPWGETIEFSTPEGVRWSLAHAPNFPSAQGVQTPHIGWTELKAADRDGQEQFYTQIMGLTIGERYDSSVRLEQGAGNPQLFIEPGGEQVITGQGKSSSFLKQPVWTSFETPDIDEASKWLTARKVPLVRDVTSHDWGGKDIVIEDVDGNPIQVVEYLDT